MMLGSQADGYVNLHSLILIIGMFYIVNIADEAGVFQFIAVIAVKQSNAKPIYLMTIFAFIAVIFSALLNNILTVMILIPLTITVSRILNINPTPYILTQAVLVNIGGTVFSISSIPNILIVTSQGITFTDYFINVGIFSIIVAFLSILFFLFLYKPKLKIPRDELIDSLGQFDVWNVVQNRVFLFEAAGAFVILIIAFFTIPPDLIPPDMIAMTIAMILTILSSLHGLDTKKIIQRFDFELILYLLGIFVIAGGLEYSGVIDQIGVFIKNLGGGGYTEIIIIMWFAAFLSSLIDNIPITKVLIPIVDTIASSSAAPNNLYYYSLSIGANWGDNLTPLGDNILVLNLASQHKRPISMKTFWKLGFVTTLYQLCIASLYFTLQLQPFLGVVLTGTVIALICLIAILKKIGSKRTRFRIDKNINRFRQLITS